MQKFDLQHIKRLRITFGRSFTRGSAFFCQLIRVNDPHENATWVYSYDRGGNITSKVKYAYTTGTVGTAQQTVNYTYGDANWKDKLTAYNGTSISYDAIGNPTSDGTWTYTWQAGRQLKQMTKSDKTVEFVYNHEGLRVKKTVGTVTTLYTLHGKNIVHLTHGNSDWMHFFYDAAGKVASVNYNGQRYAYLYNMQGDVVGLLDSTGAEVVKYTYDAWGRLLSKTGTLASTLGTIQPFRYRGYVYDDETGLYYLRSRYYNPSWGRFLNSDTVLGFAASLKNRNTFAYCDNNAVNQSDASGQVSYSITSPLGDQLMSLREESAGSGGGFGIIGFGLYEFLREVTEYDFSHVTIREKDNDNTGSDPDLRVYTVYCLSDQDNIVQYVGRTKDLDKRLSAHKRNPFRSGLHLSHAYSGLTLEGARGMEQALMLFHHTLKPENKTNNIINGVSAQNSKRNIYFDTAKKFVTEALPYLENKLSNEILNLLE